MGAGGGGGRSAGLRSSQIDWYSDFRDAEYSGRLKFFNARIKRNEFDRQFHVLTPLENNEYEHARKSGR